MQARAWFRKGMLVVLLALASGFGPVQLYPLRGETAANQTDARWSIDYVEQAGNVGAHTSIAFDPSSGTPWISYYDGADTALKVAHRVGDGGNCGPNNTWSCQTVDEAGDVGQYSSIGVYPDSNPDPFINARRVGVAYYDATNGALKFAEYACTLGCTWEIVTVEDADGFAGAPSYGAYASMKYDGDGAPQIAYYASSTIFEDALHYASAVPGAGNCGEGAAAGLWHCLTVDSGEGVGTFASLDWSYYAGAHIAYYDGAAGDLKYAFRSAAGNCGDENAWLCQTVDGMDGSDVGQFVSLHVPRDGGDALRFAYYDATNGTLKYAAAVAGSIGNCGPFSSFQCDEIESIGTGVAQAGIALAVADAYVPIIAYRDAPEGGVPATLKVAQPANSLGLPYGNCGPEIPFATWQCSILDGGSAYQEEADYVSIGLGPSGLAMIAYSELYSFGLPVQYRLKIAYQRTVASLPIIMKSW